VNQLTAIEICAGAGGQALGLHRAKFKHLDMVEFDSDACKTLTINRRRLGLPNQVEVTPRDVREYSFDLPAGTTLDLLAGGIPCPPFSVAGKGLGRLDERDLFPEVIRLVKELQPRALMIENVKGLLSKRFDEYREELVQALTQHGLITVFWDVVEASDFGVPQRRPRSVLVALQRENMDKFLRPKRRSRTVTVGAALRPLLDHWAHADEWADGAQVVAPTLVGGSRKHGGADLGPTGAKRAWDRIGVNGHLVANDPPAPDHSGPLTLTVEHAARLQGFPPTWTFAGLKTSRYRQVGNAFPPPVAEAFGKAIARALV
jgi:DNA (cytosine-5)-methyltransferase 1